MGKILLAFVFLFLSSKPIVASDASILIINQIRGDEKCCTQGSLELVHALQEDKSLANLPYGWALRFDALESNEYINPLKNTKGELGLLFEVTPNLASASGVAYRGRSDGTDWYYAKNAFLVGYSTDERKKIIDTLFDTFKQKLGVYPAFTVSWMIDAWSLSYINKTYNVQLHELTKEQYETDSYTLYGGVFNAPYYPSRLHPLIPGIGKEKLDLVMVRQTVSDILQNYGVAKAYYTSQPNDYLNSSEKLDISYFKTLVNDSLTQSSGVKTGVLGFENSFSWERYGKEYIKQLSYVAQLEKEMQIKILTPSEYAKEFKQNYRDNLPFYLSKNFYPGKDDGVLWYFGENYRARVIKKGDQVILDDLRNYLVASDPYIQTPSQADYAYWIIPYLIDGSQQYTLSPIAENALKKKGLLSSTVLPDTNTNPFGIVLGEGDFTLKQLEKGAEIIFSQENSGSVQLLPDQIVIDQNLEPFFTSFFKINILDIFNSQKISTISSDKHFDLQIKPAGDKLILGYLADNNFIPLFNIIRSEQTYSIFTLDNTAGLDLLSPLFQPDRSYLPLDKDKSVFYWNNKQAIAGRNPVRLFILPLNSLGRPTNIEKVEVQLSNSFQSASITYPTDYSYRITPWFVDIWAASPLKTDVSLKIDNKEVLNNIPIEFFSDCRSDMKACLYDPPRLFGYVKILFAEQRTRLITALRNLR